MSEVEPPDADELEGRVNVDMEFEDAVRLMLGADPHDEADE